MRQLIVRSLLELRQNYWFIPSLLTLLAILLGLASTAVDARLGSGVLAEIGLMQPIQVEGARAILTTVAGAVLGVAGVAFSITIVAVSFASGNYGPRLIGNFMRDRTNQVVLGVFLATFVYCITVLSTVHGAGEEEVAFVPQISVVVALALTLASIVAMIAYIHHVPESIDIMNLAARIGLELGDTIDQMLDAEAVADREAGADLVPFRRDAPGPNEAAIRAERPGYVLQYDLSQLHALAEEKDVQVVVICAPGRFVVAGEVLLRVRPATRLDAAGTAAFGRCHTLGANRTGVQDVFFEVDQLVEVLGRALSPGVNDPHTAILCLDWLRAGLTPFAARPPSPPLAGTARVLYDRVTFEAMLSHAYSKMRQYVAADRNVTLHALAGLAEIAKAASRESRADAVRHEMTRLAASAGELLAESAARAEVEEALASALAAMDEGRATPA
ncbi:DUF2254 domain-containing protein [Acuticoccus mangrovi]|uniref:DUF2254 domain-containing protein n=1 Tax=Acuticoccus mangrovi TaxID=2796142 RepID=A0A934MJR0_9HYPH|nr:DUF2254 domain-containing protein [Acuticoccus mangrovi]MBJ3778571.1 DUF2254 domain-containing protein [Acuticoccus mangrovi]